MIKLTFAAVLCTLISMPALAEETPQTEVMVLGSYHFANPGRDVANMEVDDVLVPKRQAEIDAVVKAIAAWKPDKILVESQQPGPDFHVAEYAKYRAGGLRDVRNESVQIGYRLADYLGHEFVYGFDEQPSDGEPDYFPMGLVIETAAKTGQTPLIDRFMTDIKAEVAAMGEAQKTSTIPASLSAQNDLDSVTAAHSKYYYGLLPVGDDARQAGAELNAAYYLRNAKMAGKIDMIAKPGERIFVLVGAGHLYWLHHFLQEMNGYTYVSPNPYLAKADGMLAAK